MTPTETPFAKKLRAYNNRSSPGKKTLYAIPFEVYKRGYPNPISSGIEYVQADDAAEARYQFCRSYRANKTTRFKPIAIAPAIGYFVEDNKGDILST